jgi:hypothetical protein
MMKVVCVSASLIVNDVEIVIVPPGATVGELAVVEPAVIGLD